MLAVDASNYSDPFTPASLASLRSAGVEHVIVQAVDPPPGYPPGVTGQQVMACIDAGFSVDAYVWLWFDADIDDIHHKLSLIDGLAIRQLWLDVEDTAAIRYDAATCNAKVSAALAVCDAYGTTSGQRCGTYSGRWFWIDNRYMGNTTAFADRELWDANYDDVADAAMGFVPYGGWTGPRIKQFRGSTTVGTVGGLDLNVLSVLEAGELEPPPPTPPADPCAGLVSSLGYIAGDLLKPIIDQKAPASKALQRLVAGIRSEADAHGIGHA
jgi:hypothetical protein